MNFSYYILEFEWAKTTVAFVFEIFVLITFSIVFHLYLFSFWGRNFFVFTIGCNNSTAQHLIDEETLWRSIHNPNGFSQNKFTHLLSDKSSFDSIIFLGFYFVFDSNNSKILLLLKRKGKRNVLLLLLFSLVQWMPLKQTIRLSDFLHTKNCGWKNGLNGAQITNIGQLYGYSNITIYMYYTQISPFIFPRPFVFVFTCIICTNTSCDTISIQWWLKA